MPITPEQEAEIGRRMLKAAPCPGGKMPDWRNPDPTAGNSAVARVVRALREHGGPMTIGEIARATGMETGKASHAASRARSNRLVDRAPTSSGRFAWFVVQDGEE